MRRKRIQNRKGFTLAEVLIVIAIVIILAAVSFVAVPQYQRSTELLELDGVAKEIFVAAQNHLSMASTQGLLAQRAKTAGENADKVLGTQESGNIYYFVVPGSSLGDEDSILSLMLPDFSLDETVRVNGSYIIRYDLATATVLDVFYAKKSGSFAHSFSASELTLLLSDYRDKLDASGNVVTSHKEDRKKYGESPKAVIGWYGGADAELLIAASKTLKLSDFEIKNDDTLRVLVPNPYGSGSFDADASLRLMVRGKLSGKTQPVDIAIGNGTTVTYPNGEASGGVFTVVLDDVTGAGSHFTQKFPGFLPGEDLEITLETYSTSAIVSTPAPIGPKTTNSLFASLDAETAKVTSFRHLLNLDASVSGFAPVSTAPDPASDPKVVATGAEQTTDLDWNAFINNALLSSKMIRGADGASVGVAAENYLPVILSDNFDYNGGNNSVTGVKVANYAGDAGLFGNLYGSTLENLKLVDFSIEAVGVDSDTVLGNAGALVGKLSGGRVSNVIAYHSPGAALGVSGKLSAGGLIGLINGSGSIVDSSAAAVIVTSTAGDAGGLIGRFTDESYTGAHSVINLKNSYAGGHTEDGAYSSSAANVTASGAAGGLVGSTDGSLYAKYTYSTCSVRGGSASGGLIGDAGNSAVSTSYAVGAVYGSGCAALLGSSAGATLTSCRWFGIINPGLSPANGSYTPGDSNNTAIDASLSTYNAFICPNATDAAAGAAMPYDSTLLSDYHGKWDMRSVALLNTSLDSGAPAFLSTHYGDWPEPQTKVVNAKSLKTVVYEPGSVGNAQNAMYTPSSVTPGAVTLLYEDAARIPEGTRLHAEALQPGTEEYTEYLMQIAEVLDLRSDELGEVLLLNLSLYGNSSELQPAAPVSVELSLAGLNTAAVRVIHFGETPELLPATVRGENVSFTTGGFSIFAVTVDANGNAVTPPMRTYEFYNCDVNGVYSLYEFQTTDGVNVHSQTLFGNGKLIVPQLPSMNSATNSTFEGWYVYTPGDGGPTANDGTYAAAPLDFNNLGAITATETVYLRARYANYAYVIFHEQYNGASGNWPVTATRRAGLNNGVAYIRVDDITVTYDDSGDNNNQQHSSSLMSFRGWSLVPIKPGTNLDYDNNPVTIVYQGEDVAGLEGKYVTGSATKTKIDLYPVFLSVNWLTFVSGEKGTGATYFPPRYYFTDEKLSATTVNSELIPRRTGYTFTGWYAGSEDPNTGAITLGTKILNVDGSLAIGGTSGSFVNDGGALRITADATLYAGWQTAQTNYSVVIWQQRPTDEVGGEKHYDFYECITRQAQTGSTVNATNADLQKNFTGFNNPGSGNYDTNVTVKADGSSVINVYYDRRSYTLTFRASRNGTVYKTITALYEHSIGDNFPINAPGYTGDRWSPPNNSSTFNNVLVYIDVMPAESVTFTRSTSTASTKYMNYYVEALPGETPDLTRGGVGYVKRGETITANYNFVTEAEDFIELVGFDKNGSDPAFANGQALNSSSGQNTINFFYLRKNYNLEFRDSVGNTLLGSASVAYGAAVQDYIIADPTPANPDGQYFTGWYADSACSKRAFFTQEAYDASTLSADKKTLIDTMPSHAVQLFAGWDNNWLIVRVDPNGGQLDPSYSTWFWKVYGADDAVVYEYTQTTRNYIEDLTVTGDDVYYYHLYDRAYYNVRNGLDPNDINWQSEEDNWKPRDAYYTNNPQMATDTSTTYAYSENIYRYSNWFEVFNVGQPDEYEELYKFGTPITHNTYLRLHWKQIGTYRLRYDPKTEICGGTLNGSDSNEETFQFLDSTDYADHSDIVVTRTVDMPAHSGYNFIGWRIHNDPSGTVYYPGQGLEFQSKYAVTEIDPNTGREKKYLILDAVYTQLPSASIIYDANGGTVSDGVDYGAPLAANAPAFTTSHDAGTATIAALLNNSSVRLSNGTGFSHGYTDSFNTFHAYTFTGWNTEPDGSGTHYDAGSPAAADQRYFVSVDYDEQGNPKPVTLYAEWQFEIRFDKHKDASNWGGAWDDVDENGDPIYTLNASGQYVRTVYLNQVIEAPAYTPTATDGSDKRFMFWTENAYTDNADAAVAFDFSQPLTKSLTLYGFWADPIRLPYHIVDASAETLVLRDNTTSATEWETSATVWQNTPGYFLVTTGTDIPLTTMAETVGADKYATLPTGTDYSYAFACVGVKDDLSSVSEARKIDAVVYDTATRYAAVRYAGDTELTDLSGDQEIYLVYFEDPVTLPIGYKLMGSSGTLGDPARLRSRPETATVSPANAEYYDMQASVSQPRYYAYNDYTYYAFAIGEKNAASDASLRLITASSQSDSSRPNLRIRNTWRGLQYSLDGGTSWVSCGYDLGLYVIYFESEPVVITLNEKTVGKQSDMTESFAYTITVTQTETKYEQVDRYSQDWRGNWNFDQTITAYHQVGNPSVTSLPGSSCNLTNGTAETTTLFYSSTSSTATGAEYSSGGWFSTTYRNVTTTTTVITQTITITEVPTARQAAEFTTDHDGSGTSHTSNLIYTYTTAADSTDQSVTFTNTRIKDEVELHVALAVGGGFALRDSTLRNDAYKTLTLNLGETKNLKGELPANLFTGDSSYVFAGVLYGTISGSTFTPASGSSGVSTLGFTQPDGSEYYKLYFDGNPTLTAEGYDIVYVYMQMPKIYFVKQLPSGALQQINPMTAGGSPVSGTAQGDTLNVQSGSTFRITQDAFTAKYVPPRLDGLKNNSLTYVSIGIGTTAANLNIGDLASSTGRLLSLRISGGQLQYSFDGSNWNSCTENPAVYAIYKENSYTLNIKKTAEGSGEKAFPIVVSSAAITDDSYEIVKGDGTSVTGVTVTPASGDTPGTIAMTVADGSDITIHALQQGTYYVTETLDLERYTVTAALDGNSLTVSTTDNEGETDYAAVAIPLTATNKTDYVLTINNKLKNTSISFQKRDCWGEPLPGATFTLYKDGSYAANVIVGTATSGADGTVTFESVPIRNSPYYMRETTVPSGFMDEDNSYLVVAKDRGQSTIRLNETGSTERLATQTVIVNHVDARKFVILKKVDDKSDPLSGAEFELRRYDGYDYTVGSSTRHGTVVPGTAPSSANGAFYIGTLADGKYYLYETTPPSGYNAPTEPFILMIRNGVATVTAP